MNRASVFPLQYSYDDKSLTDALVVLGLTLQLADSAILLRFMFGDIRQMT